MKADEVAAIERALRERKRQASDYVFHSDRSEKMSRSAFWRIVSQAGKRAGLPVKAYAHQLRHACGYYLANKGCDLRLIQDYLGHKQIQNTVRYTALNPAEVRGALVKAAHLLPSRRSAVGGEPRNVALLRRCRRYLNSFGTARYPPFLGGNVIRAACGAASRDGWIDTACGFYGKPNRSSGGAFLTFTAVRGTVLSSQYKCAWSSEGMFATMRSPLE